MELFNWLLRIWVLGFSITYVVKSLIKSKPVYYTYKSREYKYLETLMMKDPTTREWYRAVMYKDIHNYTYVREYDDFMNKFKKVKR